MGKREKRLEKGIDSMEEQIILHEEKKAIAKQEGKEELARYFINEIENIKKRILDRQSKVHRKDKDYKEQEDIKDKNSNDKDKNEGEK